MKSKFTRFYVGFAVLFLLCSNSFNPPNNYTGSPASPGNRTCSNCHGGGNFNGSVAITGLPSEITPNEVFQKPNFKQFLISSPRPFYLSRFINGSLDKALEKINSINE